MYKAMVAGWVAGLVAGWVAGRPAENPPPPPRWLAQLCCTKGKSHLVAMHARNSLFPHCLLTIRSPLVHCLFTLCSPYLGRRNTQDKPPLGTKSTQQGHEGSETIFVY